jgi:serine/threonine-protein kinase
MEETSFGDLGCMVCWLRVGLSNELEPNEADGSSVPLPDQFGSYVVERRDDGSPWELGRGAMGVTYRAIDTSLQRSVALKIINTDLAARSAEARERFIREARLAASLRHSNVATVHHFGIREETGQCFCAMELVEGETLDDRVRRMGPLDVRTVVEIACQIAAALAAAEKRGLVHRDLKPANVMISASEEIDSIAVKVIDFGVAKALAETPDARVLTHNGFIGTPAFASPEQFANAPVDTRSDIYSLGATLWYLLTGHMPFGDRVLSRMRDHRKSVAPPVEQLKAARVPSRLIALLVSMLAIEPAARPGVRELATRLEIIRAQLADRGKVARRLAFAAALIVLAISAALFVFRPVNARKPNDTANLPEQSIAVLPFENRSEEKENAFFADGMQDDLLTSLIKIKELKVVGRSSVTGYRDGTKRNLREIGRQLGVAHVLEGSVRRVADRMLIHVNLTDTRDGRAVWAERYDRTLADSIGLQGEVAIEIAVVLRTKLAPEEKTRLSEKPTNNPEAYTLYLKGLAHERDADIIAAEQLYTEAIALDPSFALAHARASILNSGMYHFANDFVRDPAQKSKARAEAGEALRLSPTLGEAHLALGLYFYRGEKNYTAALKEFSIAVTALPNDREVLELSAWIYRRQNRWREALATLERAQNLDPRRAIIDLPKTYRMVRDWSGAAAAFHRVLEIQPDSRFALARLAWLEVEQNGDPAAGKAIMRKMTPAADAGDRALITLTNWDLSMIERDFPTAEKILAGYASEEFPAVGPKSFYEAHTALARGDAGLAQMLFEKARSFYETQVRDHPDFAYWHSQLGLVYAYLGRKEDAIRESRRAVDLAPESKDAVDGPLWASNLALVYARTGEADQAITLIERLLSTPGPDPITLADLRLRWEWDPLRSNPRFQKILAGPEPKTIY